MNEEIGDESTTQTAAISIDFRRIYWQRIGLCAAQLLHCYNARELVENTFKILALKAWTLHAFAQDKEGNMTALAISRPTKQYCYKANLQLFLAVPAAYASYWFMPNQHSEMYTWVICGVAGFVAVRCVISGLVAFRNDYRLNYKFETAQAPSNTAYDARFATTAEIEAAGCYDGKGRVIGIDVDGRPLFVPHKLRPTNSRIIAAAGAGKTTAFCISSTILSLFSAWEK